MSAVCPYFRILCLKIGVYTWCRFFKQQLFTRSCVLQTFFVVLWLRARSIFTLYQQTTKHTYIEVTLHVITHIHTYTCTHMHTCTCIHRHTDTQAHSHTATQPHSHTATYERMFMFLLYIDTHTPVQLMF